MKNGVIRKIAGIFFALLLLSVAPPSVFAQEEDVSEEQRGQFVDDVEYTYDENLFGSSGFLVSAALETAGHAMQDAVLDFFAEGFVSRFAPLLYIISGIGAIIIAGIGGNYKFGLWFLFAPGIFYFMVFSRVESRGAQWKFGVREYPQIQVQAATEGVRPEQNRVGDVSWFFATWDSVVSHAVETTVGLMRLDVRNVDLSFISRTERYNSLLNMEVQNDDLRLFLRLTLISDCREYLGMMRDLYSWGQRIGANNNVGGSFRRDQVEPFLRDNPVRGDNEIVQLALAQGWLVQKSEGDDGGVEWTPVTYETQKEVYTCEELWQSSLGALKDHAHDLYKAVIARSIPEGMSQKDVDSAIARKIRVNDEAIRSAQERLKEEGLKPYQTKKSKLERHVENLKETEEVDEELVAELEERIRELDDIINHKERHTFGNIELSEEAKVLVFLNEVAVRMLFRVMKEDGDDLANSLQWEFKDHPVPWFYTNNGKDPEWSKPADHVRLTHTAHEYEGKGTYLNMVLSIPYMQGVTLYFLAVMFPFFAFSLLLPGKHHAFLLWMGLWLWVKTWDIGIAVVMILDELLYNLMPHGPPVTDEIANDPAEAIKTILEVDPSYSVNTYFTILATLITAVPIVSGVLVKRGGGEIVHAVSQGFNNFSGRIGFAILQFHTAMMNQDRAERVQFAENKAIRMAARKGLTDKVFLANMAAATGDAVLAQRLKGRSGAEQGGVMHQALQAAGQSLGQEARRYHFGLAMARYNQIMKTARYNESQSMPNLRLAGDAIHNWYSHHDWVSSHPWNEELGYLAAEVDFVPGRIVNDVATSVKIRTPWDSKR